MDLPFTYQRDRLLSTLCTFGIGGPARYYVEVREVAVMQSLLLFCKEHALPFFILGKGSNCLFDDQGFNGVVIHNKIDFLERPAPGRFRAGAGYSFSLLGVQSARDGWSGLEFASGIPASVGGAVFMNAGANGAEVSNAVVSVEFVDENGALHEYAREDLHFSYRTSDFQQMRGAIVSATFALTRSEAARKKQLEIVEYRVKTQPYGEKSAGCIFRNPSCASAGALIDQAGLKTLSCGNAEVSAMHANFIVNKGQATARDVLQLIEWIKKAVFEKKGVQLESEVRYIANISEDRVGKIDD